MPEALSTTSRILVAGIGNIFLGDDAFGVEVAKELAQQQWPAGVRVVDMGIRGIDLAFTLLEGWEAAILVDAAARGGIPGDLYLIRPEPADPNSPSPMILQGHNLDPAKVLDLVSSLGGKPTRVWVVGCEPSPFDAERDMQMELSPVVQAAIPGAAAMVRSLVNRILAGDPELVEISQELSNLEVKGASAYEHAKITP